MDFPLLGAVVNAAAIIVCGLIGTLIGAWILIGFCVAVEAAKKKSRKH